MSDGILYVSFGFLDNRGLLCYRMKKFFEYSQEPDSLSGMLELIQKIHKDINFGPSGIGHDHMFIIWMKVVK